MLTDNITNLQISLINIISLSDEEDNIKTEINTV